VSIPLRTGLVLPLATSMLFFALGMAGAQDKTPAAGPLAEVNDEPITGKDLEQGIGTTLSQLEEQIYGLKRRELEALIAKRLIAQEAARRGVAVSALVDTEVTAKVPPVTEQDIDTFYQANKARMRGDEAKVREQIRTNLQQQNLAARREEFVNSLRARAKIVTRLPRPPVVRMDVRTEGGPVRGSAEAPVTLVEFSDFQCPFCKRSQATLNQLLERYPGKLKIVYRDFPLDQLHPQARGASEAARCAGDQGKFWDYHDVLFTQAPPLSPDAMRRYAEQAGLDLVAFDRCLSSGQHRDAVQRDVEEGMRLGVTGTPAFFINGRPLVGAQQIEAFTRVIDEELASR
jgi:protein-disulfide isomerase